MVRRKSVFQLTEAKFLFEALQQRAGSVVSQLTLQRRRVVVEPEPGRSEAEQGTGSLIVFSPATNTMSSLSKLHFDYVKLGPATAATKGAPSQTQERESVEISSDGRSFGRILTSTLASSETSADSGD